MMRVEQMLVIALNMRRVFHCANDLLPIICIVRFYNFFIYLEQIFIFLQRVIY